MLYTIFLALIKSHSFTSYTEIYVTGFAKNGLQHTSNLPTLTIHNCRCVKVMNLKFLHAA